MILIKTLVAYSKSHNLHMIKLLTTAMALVICSSVPALAQNRYGLPQATPNGKAGSTKYPAVHVTPGFTNSTTGRKAPSIYGGPRGGIYIINGRGKRQYLK